ncbi:MAG: malto-oligosyltrehalose synthase [Pararhodobacter sp.]
MKLPTSCYRLQFRQGMDFDRAAELAPYWADLGISHLYASPLFTAQQGSTHGYDITDPGEIDPVLGGIDGLKRLSKALKDNGLGLILDIVPNHMAFSVETPWLRDVLRHGTGSRYAKHFDMDPTAERIRLPWLGAPFEDQLNAGDLSVQDDPEGPALVAGGLRVPLADTPSLATARNGDPEALRALHAEQPWRLVHWRTEHDIISHRRFFSVTGLIGIRVEDETVFDDMHRLLFDLADTGIVDGIRIDHIDGLADPDAYLERLRARVPETPIWVEKILSGSETLPRQWPIEGTTGYVVARALSRLLTDGEGLEKISTLYREATGRIAPVEDVMHIARHQVMTADLAAELWALHGMLSEIAAADAQGVEFGPEVLREALLEMIAAFPRYRTYMTEDRVPEADARLIRETAQHAEARLNHPGALPFLAEVLTRAVPETARFRRRFQQITGAAVAKSAEDTAFYREVRLLSANEVGGDPDDDPLGTAGFHRAMERRASLMPHGLSLTSSHDTKRSEDARMRIAAITRAPEAFASWHRICVGFAPERLNANLVWYVAQTFLALQPGDGDMAERLSEHVVKALREAKSESFWTAPDVELETAAQNYVRRLAAHFPGHARDVQPILDGGDRLSLIQTALKLTVPGIPDIYQGCEMANYSLTDPDNRRAVDFDLLGRAVADSGVLATPLDRDKFDLTRRLLHLRRDEPDLFLNGAYRRLASDGQSCAFERVGEARTLSVSVTLSGIVEKKPEGQILWPPDDRDSAIIIALSETA